MVHARDWHSCAVRRLERPPASSPTIGLPAARALKTGCPVADLDDDDCCLLKEIRMMTLLGLAVVGATIWVAMDASGRDWSDNRFADASWKWVAGVLLLWFVAIPLYLVHRRRVPGTGSAAGPVVAAGAFTAPEKPEAASKSVPPPGRR
jgi:hypothetical protein